MDGKITPSETDPELGGYSNKLRSNKRDITGGKRQKVISQDVCKTLCLCLLRVNPCKIKRGQQVRKWCTSRCTSTCALMKSTTGEKLIHCAAVIRYRETTPSADCHWEINKLFGLAVRKISQKEVGKPDAQQ